MKVRSTANHESSFAKQQSDAKLRGAAKATGKRLKQDLRAGLHAIKLLRICGPNRLQSSSFAEVAFQ